MADKSPEGVALALTKIKFSLRCSSSTPHDSTIKAATADGPRPHPPGQAQLRSTFEAQLISQAQKTSRIKHYSRMDVHLHLA